jgi:putative acetyltransferase
MRRLAREEDLEPVFRIYMHESVIPFLGHDPMPLDEFRGVYQGLLGSGAFFVYELSGRIAGFFKVTRLEGRARHVAVLGTLAVSPDAHGQGVGRAMMNEAVSMLRALGIRRIELLVEADNQKARAFYSTLGFEQEGVLRKAYKRADEAHYVDEIQMALLLDAGAGA